MPEPVPHSHFEVRSDGGAGGAPGNPRPALPGPTAGWGLRPPLSCQGLGAQPEMQPGRRCLEVLLPELVSSLEEES